MADRKNISGVDAHIAVVAEEHHEVVLRICRARLPTESDAQDAFQETLLRFLEADHSRIGHPTAWFASVAVRVCAAWHARRYKRPELPVAEAEHILSDKYCVDVADIATDHAWLHGLAARLTRREYQLLHWLYVQQLSTAQVAAMLGITAGHVRILSFRARRSAAVVLTTMSESMEIG